MARKPKQQPRSLTLPPSSTHYRGGMHLELQKFQDTDKARQLLLSEGLEEDELQAEIEKTGLNLTVSEDKALSALQFLLDQTRYQGNEPGQEVASDTFKWQGTLPRLSTTYQEYLSAYGLSGKDHLYQGHQAQMAIEALKSLEQPRRVCYTRKRYEGQGKKRKKVTDVVVAYKPLISILRGYEGLEEEEAEAVLAGQELLERTTVLRIEFSPLVMDQIESFYLLKPLTLHDEIQALLGGKRASRAYSLFIQWLLTLNRASFSIAKEVLAEKLWLDKMIQHRNRSRMEKTLQEALRIAKELGYLLDYSEDAYGLLRLRLNPEKCSRLKAEEEE